ncbi:DUF1279 super [Aspergillus niger]|uniref:DUF1279 super n=1 Tax=Aspergillus niger TaxID=5061 RepID=A0A9W5ZQ00_ASPNG|nr:hypothetical protein CBS133816_6548 [Aspergillus niger]KAI2859156.1 hypothetical protein CBS12448_5855 [Aspergillus niger]KAI3039258.1 hypothetical protein CBS147352_10406 [Aspergillus niger]GLA45343.1 DUF1279 super [Aspergillus niger]
MSYTPAQLAQYFERIKLPDDIRARLSAGKKDLEVLTSLVRHHVAGVPFENTVLHYTPEQYFELKPQGLHEKIVRRRQGGTCFQVVRILSEVLLSIGYTLYNSAARLNAAASISLATTADPNRPVGPQFGDWQHMVLIVRIDGQDYLVDGGFGPNCPVQPIALRDGHEFVDGRLGRRGRLIYDNINNGRAHHLKYWRLQYQSMKSPVAPWMDVYAFKECEWLDTDYEAGARAVGTNKRIWFRLRVTAFHYVLEEGVPVGWNMLWHNTLIRFHGGKVLEKSFLESEEERIEVLADVFGIVLTEDNRKEIAGMFSALPPRRARSSKM